MKANIKELKEYFTFCNGINLESFKALSRKYLEYKLERILEYKDIQLIDVGHQTPETMYARFKVDELDIVIKMCIHNTEPDEPYIQVECDECHEINERPFTNLLELMAAINNLSSHKLHKDDEGVI